MWSAHAHTHRRARRDACSLRMVGGVVVTRRPMGTGFLRTERSIPSAFSGTFAPDKQGRSCTPAVEEGDERAPGIYSLSFFSSSGQRKLLCFLPTNLRKDERRLRHPGVHLTRGHIRGKTGFYF